MLLFNARYVDNALLIIKKKYISFISNQFNSFDKNLKFTTDVFENCISHILDMEVYLNGLGIYHKHVQTGQYVHINCYTLWRWKTLWICKKICSGNYSNKEIQLLKDKLLGMVTHKMLLMAF